MMFIHKTLTLLKGLLALLLVFQAFASQAQEDLPFIIAPEVNTLFYDDKTGPYDKLFQEFEALELISGYQILPSLRARRSFLREKNHCYSPIDESIFDMIDLDKKDLVFSHPYNLVTGVLLFKNNHPALKDDKVLENTIIGVVGLPSNSKFGLGGYDFKKIKTPSYEKLMELFDRGLFEGIYIF